MICKLDHPDSGGGYIARQSTADHPVGNLECLGGRRGEWVVHRPAIGNLPRVTFVHNVPIA